MNILDNRIRVLVHRLGHDVDSIVYGRLSKGVTQSKRFMQIARGVLVKLRTRNRSGILYITIQNFVIQERITVNS